MREGHRLELPGDANNDYVVADAARFTPAASKGDASLFRGFDAEATE